MCISSSKAIHISFHLYDPCELNCNHLIVEFQSVTYVPHSCQYHSPNKREKKAQLVIIPKDNCIYFRLCIFNLKQKMHLNRVICEVSGLHDNGHLIVVDTASLGAKIIESVGHWKWFSLNYFPFQFCEFFRLIWVFVFEKSEPILFVALST